MKNHFYCVFRGYRAVIRAYNQDKALERMVTFVQQDHLNMNYSRQDIIDGTTVTPGVEYVDNIGDIRALSAVDRRIDNLGKKIDEDTDRLKKMVFELQDDVENIRAAFRGVFGELPDEDDEWNY